MATMAVKSVWALFAAAVPVSKDQTFEMQWVQRQVQRSQAIQRLALTGKTASPVLPAAYAYFKT